MFPILWTILSRDLKVYRRRSGETFLALIFFFMIASLFPMVLQQPLAVLSEFAPAIIWVSILLASLLSYETLYRLESEEDSILQLLLSPFPLALLLFGKAIAHWLWTGFPLSMISVLLSLSFGLSVPGILCLLLTLVLGTLTLSFIALIGVGLTFSLQRGGLLLTLLLIPLIMPLLLLGVSAVMQANHGGFYMAEIALLTAILLFVASFAPFAAAAAFRAGVT